MSFSRCYGQHRLPFGIMTSFCIKAVSLAVEEGTTSFDPSPLQIKHYACDIDGGLDGKPEVVSFPWVSLICEGGLCFFRVIMLSTLIAQHIMWIRVNHDFFWEIFLLLHFHTFLCYLVWLFSYKKHMKTSSDY